MDLLLNLELLMYSRDDDGDYEIDDGSELSWDDIQRLTCAFIICVLGTAAHKGKSIQLPHQICNLNFKGQFFGLHAFSLQ